MAARSVEPALYFVATPIGAARDITLRALDILREADVIAAEDTRTIRKLMEIHGIARDGRPIVAYHDHNATGMRDRLLDHLRAGRSVACVSEAGTPLLSDPGFDIGRAAIAAGLAVRAAPGASALLAALSVSGLPTDRFFFAGFPPAKAAARRSWLAEIAAMPATVVLYESPRRVGATLADLAELFGPDRPAALCRELTKRFEETLRGPLSELCAILDGRDALKGEIVLVIGASTGADTEADPEELLRAALEKMRVKDAATHVAGLTGRPRKEIYQLALKVKGD